MARPLKTEGDPLVPFAVRIPESLSIRIRREAAESGRSLGDHVRARMSYDEAKPLGKRSPRKREKLAEVSAADPALLRQLGSIGNNINQLARAVNSDLLGGTPVQNAQVMMILRAIELKLNRLG